MKPLNKKHPDVRAYVPRFRAFAEAHPGKTFGSTALWVALEKHPDSPDGWREFEDEEDRELYALACELSFTQREKLAGYLEHRGGVYLRHLS
jgi:hypothetical protein